MTGPFLVEQHLATPALILLSPHDVDGYKLCSRCSRPFRPPSGRFRLCGSCRRGGGARPRGRQSFGTRYCAACGRPFTAYNAHAKYCDGRCRARATRPIDRLLYDTPAHRARPRQLEPLVRTGQVRCAGGRHCLRREFVDGQWLGGFIGPNEEWHLGHADAESVGGPEHRRCNVGAPQRRRRGIGRQS